MAIFNASLPDTHIHTRTQGVSIDPSVVLQSRPTRSPRHTPATASLGPENPREHVLSVRRQRHTGVVLHAVPHRETETGPLATIQSHERLETLARPIASHSSEGICVVELVGSDDELDNSATAASVNPLEREVTFLASVNERAPSSRHVAIDGYGGATAAEVEQPFRIAVEPESAIGKAAWRSLRSASSSEVESLCKGSLRYYVISFYPDFGPPS